MDKKYTKRFSAQEEEQKERVIKLADTLEKLRLDQFYSHRELAEEIGIHPITLHSFLSKNTPLLCRPQTLRKIYEFVKRNGDGAV